MHKACVPMRIKAVGHRIHGLEAALECDGLNSKPHLAHQTNDDHMLLNISKG